MQSRSAPWQQPPCMRSHRSGRNKKPDRVQSRYNSVNFLPKPHNRHHIAHPQGQAMGCLLWMLTLITMTSYWARSRLKSLASPVFTQPFIGRISKKTLKLRVTGLCVGNSPGTGEFPAQMASNAENVSIWWRHHADICSALVIVACNITLCWAALWRHLPIYLTFLHRHIRRRIHHINDYLF